MDKENTLQLNQYEDTEIELAQPSILGTLGERPSAIIETPKEYVEMDKLSLSSPLEFLSKYNSPKEWILEQEEAERVRVWGKETGYGVGTVGKIEYGLGEAIRETAQTPGYVAQLGVGLYKGLYDLVFPNSSETALDRLYTSIALSNIETNARRERELELYTGGDSDIVEWTSAIAKLAIDLTLAGIGAGLGASAAKKSIEKLATETAKGVATSPRVIRRATSIAAKRGATKGQLATTLASTFAQEAGESALDSVRQYIAETGDTTLKNYKPGADSLMALAVGGVNAAIEAGFGVERFVPEFWGTNTNIGRVTRRLVEGVVGEGTEELSQSVVSQIGEILNGYRNNIDWNQAFHNAIVGGVLGGAAGSGMYYLNRRRLARQLAEEYNMDYKKAASLVDDMLGVGIEKTTNELSARSELLGGKGQAWDKMINGVKTAMESVNFGDDETRNSQATQFAKTNTAIAIREAEKAGLSTEEFLDIAEFSLMNNGQNMNMVFVKPLGTVADIDERIKKIDEKIKREQELKKTGAGDNKIIRDAKMQKAILQKAKAIKQFNDAQYREQIKAQTTPETAQEIETATKDAEIVKNSPTQADFDTKVSEDLTTSQKAKRYGNAVLKRILPTKTEFDAVMVDPIYANAKQAIIAVADRISAFMTAHRTYNLKTDIANALKRMQTVNQGNFIDSITVPAMDGVDVTAENAFLYHFLFSDVDTIKTFMNAYITRAEQSVNGETKTSLSKKDLVGQAFKATDEAMQNQANVVGSEYASIYNEDGSYADKNVRAVMLSYQNQFVSDAQQVSLPKEMLEQFDLADENARLDDIYPAYEGETIEVDGKERTVYNSNGDRIAKSKEALTNFWKWFGDSKVVDEQGRPLVVYHGTNAEFDTFDTKRIGKQDYGFYGKGFYFTDTKDVAEDYAKSSAFDEGNPVVMPVYLSLKNPFFMEYTNDNGISDEKHNRLKEQGYDGVIAVESRDLRKEGYEEELQKAKSLNIEHWQVKDFEGNVVGRVLPFEFVAWEQSQIKSVDNSGTYSEKTGNIYYQSDVNNPYQSFIDIHIKAGLVENAPEKFVGGKEEVYKKLGLSDTVDTAVIQSPIESVKIQKQHIDHLVNENEPNRRGFLNYAIATIERPNLIVKNGKKNDYLKFFWVKDTVKPHLQIVKVASDGTFYVTNFRPTKSQVNKIIKEGQIIYDLSNVQISSADTGIIPSETGKVKYLSQGRAANGFYDPEIGVIVLGRNMNEMTLPHEMQHYWLDTIFNIYKRAQSGELKVRDEWMTETKDLFNMLGIDENQTSITQGQHEKFARMSEAYLTGIGVNAEQNATFKEYQKWVPEKYKSILNLGYLNDEGKVEYPFLDNAAVEFFNKWYGNPTLASLSTSPERQRFINPTDDKGEVTAVSIKEMNDRNKEFGQDAEEQVHTDERLYNTLDENMPADIKTESDGQRVIQESRSNFLKESEQQQRRWYERKSRDTEAEKAQEYLEKNPQHAKEVIYGDPELVPNDTGIDRATLINAYMALNKITPDSEDWARLHTNIAINQSLAGTQLALSNNTSYRTYLDALRQIEAARELKAATNYAGASQGALEMFNRDIQRFVDRELPKVLATAPNTQAREIALKSLFERARTKFSGNTTGAFLNQTDFDYAKAQKGANAAFTRWAINQIKKDAGAKLNGQEQAKLLEISAKAQQAMIDLDDRDAGKAVAGAQAIRKWQVEKDKLTGVAPQKFSLFGDYATRAMLASFNTLVVSNIPSTAMNTGVVRMLEAGVFGKNDVSSALTDSEIKRIKSIYNATAMNLAQMEKPTSPSLLHGEKYSSSGQKWYDPFTILGREDNWFRVPTFVNTLARIATTDAKATGRSADEVFKEYCRLENQSDEAKLARKQALAVANMAVFTQDGSLARALNGIRDWINQGSRALFGLDPKGFGVGNLLSPFLKTGANIAEMGIRGSLAPITTIAAMVQSWRSGKALDPMKKLALGMDWSYFLFSSLMVALLSALTSDDDDFYSEPYEMGKRYDPSKPYDSINIAGLWIDLDFFGPFAIPIRTGCRLVKQWKTDNLAAIYKGYGQGLKYAAMDTPLLESVFNNQMSYASKKPEDWATGYAYNQVNKLIPAQIKPLSRAFSRGTETEFDMGWSGKVIERKFHRNYGFDGAELTTQDLIDIFTTKFTWQP